MLVWGNSIGAMNSNRHATYFPDFEFEPELSAFLADWQDVSYGNDACPSFLKGRVLLYVDHIDETQRECEGGKRFFAYAADADGCLESDAPIFECDTLSEVRDLLESRLPYPLPVSPMRGGVRERIRSGNHQPHMP